MIANRVQLHALRSSGHIAEFPVRLGVAEIAGGGIEDVVKGYKVDTGGIMAQKPETEAGVTMKLKRGTFSAVFFLACIAALELEQVVLEEI